MGYELSKAMLSSFNHGTNMVHTVGGGVGGGFEDQKYETCVSNDQADLSNENGEKSIIQ